MSVDPEVRGPTAPLRRAWGLPVESDDPDGVGPQAAARAQLPPELSEAFGQVRERLPVPRLAAEGPPELPASLQEAMTAPALAVADDPLPFPLLSQYTRFWREGVRTDYEDDARRLGIMTGEAVLAAVATGQQRWIDRAADGLMLLCEMSTWCWVAHEQSHDRRGWMVPDPDAPVVDLGAGQTLHVLAWADLAIGAALDEHVPGLRQRMRREARRRVFEPYLARRDWHWLHGRAHNWTGWIHQHLIAGALFLLDGEEDRADRDAVLCLAIAQLDRYLASFPPDGGIDEGFSYFWNGACRLLEAIDLLSMASGGLLSRQAVLEIPVISELARFPHRMELGDGWFVNVADGPARPEDPQPWEVLHRWGRALGDGDVVAGALARRGDDPAPPVRPELGLGRVLWAVGDQEWRAGRPTGPPLPAETWLPEVQLLVARERAGDRAGLALAVKGGHNAEAHNHLDVGSVMVALEASPVLIDLGQPTYTAQTFSERRYEIWTMTSSWHTLPTIRGCVQGVGEEYAAQGVRAEGSSLTLDLAGAYPAEAGVRSYQRRVALERGSTPAVRIEDHWQLEPRGGSTLGDGVEAHYVLAGDVLDHRAGSLQVRALSGAIAELSWDAELGTGDLERREIDDPLLQRSWGGAVHRLCLGPTTDPETGTGVLAVVLRAV
ncbi:hypothetical protein ACFQS2_10450 [Brachybacterium sp. GCM10030267]|uniref:hypothetical protein n=1 Tax=Brachybacterium sp. GCM10030267 TaxID=3273381 RepID=UPI00361D520D